MQARRDEAERTKTISQRDSSGRVRAVEEMGEGVVVDEKTSGLRLSTLELSGGRRRG